MKVRCSRQWRLRPREAVAATRAGLSSSVSASPVATPAPHFVQVVVSDVGATIPGVTPATLQRFLLDVARAVAGALLWRPLVLAAYLPGYPAHTPSHTLRPTLACTARDCACGDMQTGLQLAATKGCVLCRASRLQHPALQAVR